MNKVIEYIESIIKMDQLQPGDKLPHAAIVSMETGIGRKGVIEAYDKMVANGHIFMIGTDYYVNKSAKSFLISDRLYASRLSLQPSLYTYYDKEKVLGRKEASLGYQIIENYKRSGIFTSEDQVLLCHHLKSAIDLIKSFYRLSDDRVMVITPLCPILNKDLEERMVEFVLVDRLDLNLLELYVRRHNTKLLLLQESAWPLSLFTLSIEEKKQLLDLCSRLDVYLVDIDLGVDLHDRSQTLYSLDTNGRVYYLKSYNCMYREELDLVSLIGPPDKVESLKRLNHSIYGHVSRLEQACLNEILAGDMSDYRLWYHDKALHLEQEIKKVNPIKDFDWGIEKGFLWVCMHNEFNYRNAIISLREKNISFISLSDFYRSNHEDWGLVFNVMEIGQASFSYLMETIGQWSDEEDVWQ